MRKCPYCAEEIQEEATKCKHCGEWLSHSVANNEITPNEEGSQPHKKKLISMLDHPLPYFFGCIAVYMGTKFASDIFGFWTTIAIAAAFGAVAWAVGVLAVLIVYSLKPAKWTRIITFIVLAVLGFYFLFHINVGMQRAKTKYLKQQEQNTNWLEEFGQ